MTGASQIHLSSFEVRYFILKNGNLGYYTDKREAHSLAPPKGSCHVLSIITIKSMPQKDRNGHNQVQNSASDPDAVDETPN